MWQRTPIYAKGPDTKLNTSIIHKAKKPFEPSLKNPIDKIMHLQRTLGNRSVARMLGAGELQAKFQIDKQTGKNRKKIGFAASMAGLHFIQREPYASARIMRMTANTLRSWDVPPNTNQ